MSVASSKRTLSESEYAKQARIVYNETQRIIRKLPKSKLHTYNVHIANTAHLIYKNACIADRIYAVTYEEARMKLNLLNEAYGSIDFLLSICDDWKNEKPQVTNPDTHMTRNAITDRRINSYAGTLMKASGAFSSSIKYFRKQLSKYKENDMQTMSRYIHDAFTVTPDNKTVNNRKTNTVDKKLKIENDDKFVYNNDVQIAKPAYDDTAHKNTNTETTAAVNNNDNSNANNTKKPSNVKNPNNKRQADNIIGSVYKPDSSRINTDSSNTPTDDKNDDDHADSNITNTVNESIDNHVFKKDNADIIAHRHADESNNGRKHYSRMNNGHNTRVSGINNANMSNSSESSYKPAYDPFMGVSEHNASMSSHSLDNKNNSDVDIKHRHDDNSNDGIDNHDGNSTANTKKSISNTNEKTIIDDNDDDIFTYDSNRKPSCVSINDISDEELFGINDTDMTANKNDSKSSSNTPNSKINNVNIDKKNTNSRKKNVNGSHEMTADEIDWSYLFNDSEND